MKQKILGKRKLGGVLRGMRRCKYDQSVFAAFGKV